MVREERALEKRGSRGTATGRRVGYLSALELSAHSRLLAKKHRKERFRHWGAKARIAQLKVSRPTLKESAKQSSDQHNVHKFSADIIVAHRTGAMGGKPALWDFLKDVATNLNRKKQGIRWSTNFVAFSQAMKIYGGRRMCELFSLNFAGPTYSTTKRVNQKGVHFVAGEHVDIFQSVAHLSVIILTSLHPKSLISDGELFLQQRFLFSLDCGNYGLHTEIMLWVTIL